MCHICLNALAEWNRVLELGQQSCWAVGGMCSKLPHKYLSHTSGRKISFIHLPQRQNFRLCRIYTYVWNSDRFTTCQKSNWVSLQRQPHKKRSRGNMAHRNLISRIRENNVKSSQARGTCFSSTRVCWNQSSPRGQKVAVPETKP